MYDEYDRYEDEEEFPPAAPDGMTLEEALCLTEDACPHHLMTPEEYDGYVEYMSEREAEEAWLKHAENLGWLDHYYDSLRESGLIAS